MLKRKEWWYVLAAAAALFIALQIPSHIAVTVTPSLHHRIFFYMPCSNAYEAKVGQYVVFDFADAVTKEKQAKVMKRVAGAAGDLITTNGDDYFCNGKYLGRAKKVSLEGNPLKHFVFNGHIPPGQLFLVGDTIDSYDSRYWGFLDSKKIKGVAYPVWPIW